MARIGVKAMSIEVPEEVADKLFVIAKRDARSVSAYVRLLLIDHVENLEAKKGKIDPKEKEQFIIAKKAKSKKEKPLEEVSKKPVVKLRKRVA